MHEGMPDRVPADSISQDMCAELGNEACILLEAGQHT